MKFPILTNQRAHHYFSRGRDDESNQDYPQLLQTRNIPILWYIWSCVWFCSGRNCVWFTSFACPLIRRGTFPSTVTTTISRETISVLPAATGKPGGTRVGFVGAGIQSSRYAVAVPEDGGQVQILDDIC